MNCLWDLLGKCAEKPVWKYISDMSPSDLVGSLDFRSVKDLITPDEAIALLEKVRSSGHEERVNEMMEHGFPAYTTATGWLGYTDEQVREKAERALKEGFTSFKMKVGVNIKDDCRRAAMMRSCIGED